MESVLWKEAQNKNIRPTSSLTKKLTLQPIPGRWCFSDGSWKENKFFRDMVGIALWRAFKDYWGHKLYGLVYPRYIQRWKHCYGWWSVWGIYVNFRSHGTYCSQLMKMVSEPEECPVFSSYLEDIKTLRENFINSEIIHVQQKLNTKADKLARSARLQSSFVVHMDAEVPEWFTE